jgi:uncharacterized membrane protein YtjA (UPF0391 family)
MLLARRAGELLLGAAVALLPLASHGAPTGVTFSAPAAGATISGTLDSSGCQVTGTGIAQVVFFMDNTQLNTENWAPWQCRLDTRNFANGGHTLRAVAYDSAGASTTVTRSVNVQNGSVSGPTGVTFSAPAAGATISGTLDSSGCQVTGTGIARVVFFMDNSQLNIEYLAPWQCRLDTRNFANGMHTLRAVAYDSAGASTTVTRSVNVQNGSVSGPTAILGWDAVTHPNLKGYRVYFGTAPRSYFQAAGNGVDVGNAITATVAGLSSGTRYYFAVTAYDTSNKESAFSNEVFEDIP